MVTDGPTGRAQTPTIRPVHSLLSARAPRPGQSATQPDRSFASDLNLDQVVADIVAEREEPDFLSDLLFTHVHDTDTVVYRQEVFRDLDDTTLFEHLQQFSEHMARVRAHLRQIETMRVLHQRRAWHLDAASIYCDAVRSVRDALRAARIESRALQHFRAYFDAYVESSEFTSLAQETQQCVEALAAIRYCVHVRGLRVDVRRYEGEDDYSAEVQEVFARFRQGAVKDYRRVYRAWPGMNRIGAQILDLVARLFPDEFTALESYCGRRTGFFSDTVRRFERELQFFLSYRGYIDRLSSLGLPFCYPEVTGASKAVFARETFDLALATSLAPQGETVVCNDFFLEGPERVFVVSGPNQGGKTTFARTFGQLHHLANVGCPVPGRAARLFLFDRLFTHFEREEDVTKLSGKLEDDLLRIQAILTAATPDSIIIMNEIFTSTTLADSLFLGTKVMRKVILLDCLCVYVTFVEELATMGESVVSLVSTIVPGNPAERTFKVVRGPADGLAYAVALAEKYNVTYERLRQRIS